MTCFRELFKRKGRILAKVKKSPKKYYWLKLKEGFFEEDTIEWLEEQENGVYYSNFYLKLCLKSLKTNGILIRNVGEILIPYDIKKLAEMTRVKIDTAIVAMELFKKIGLVQILDNGEIYLTQLELMVGSETSKAELMRNKRAREKKQCSGGGNNVTKKLPKCYTDIEKDKETELEQEQDLEKEQDTERDKDKKKEKESKMNIQTDADTETEAGTAEDRKISSCGSYINNNIRSVDKSDKSDMELAGKNSQFEMKQIFENKQFGIETIGKNNQSEMKVIGKGNTSTGSNNTKYLAIDLEEESSDSSLKVYKHFEKCGFIVTSQLMEFISEDIKSYGEEWIMDAATECVKRGKSNNYGYLTGILQNWITKGRNYKEICESKANASAYAPMKSIFDE